MLRAVVATANDVATVLVFFGVSLLVAGATLGGWGIAELAQHLWQRRRRT
jgi:hypothetical protein